MSDRIWIEHEGEKQSIHAVNWRIWKRRGARKCKPPAEPVYIGGGMYELPDGTRVRGKEAAGAE